MFTTDDYKKAILKIYLNYLSEHSLQEDEMSMWFSIANYVMDSFDIVKNLLSCIYTDREYSNLEVDVKHYIKDNIHYISYDDKEYSYNKEKVISIVRVMWSIMEDILPLGSVVTLKKDYYSNMIQEINKNEKLKKIVDEYDLDIENSAIIIQKRFVKSDKRDEYLEYAGTYFPNGQSNNGGFFIFSNEDVNEILHKGYISENERQYICLLKNELVVKNNQVCKASKIKK